MGEGCFRVEKYCGPMFRPYQGFRNQSPGQNNQCFGLEELAQNTWRDSLDWATLTQLLNAQKRTMLRAQIHLTKLARGLNLDVSVESARLDQVGSDLDDIESTVTQDFPQREQRISDLVYNIISVRNTQAAENYNTQMRAVTWITFIFFPLIAISGMFGMNVDVLADNPSIKWYFIIAVPSTALVVLVAVLIRRRRLISKYVSLKREKQA
ncbi:hypothetical protein ACJQWK_07764 [Exserohilum turcicum]